MANFTWNLKESNSEKKTAVVFAMCWGKWGDIGQSVQFPSYKSNKFGNPMSNMVIMANNTISYT